MAQLKHYGTPRHSGRYPWGSGQDGYQRDSFRRALRELEDQGLSQIEIAKAMGMTTTRLRALKSISKNEQKTANVAEAWRLKNKGYSNVAIGARMGVNESVVRSWLAPGQKEKVQSLQNTAKVLEKQLFEKGLLDVGAGTEVHLGVSRTKLDTAVKLLIEEGYEVHNIQVKQLGTGKETTIKTLCPPGMTFPEAYKKRFDIQNVAAYTTDDGQTWDTIKPPVNIDSKRVFIRYYEDGGANKDGVIELRRGVDDISLGDKSYAQVRMAVDGTHFMKGMALHTDNIPDGYDIVYNVNKKKGTPKDDVFKPLTDDPNNPFKTTIRQKTYLDADGNEHLSALNIVNEEGKWRDWSKSISSQVLSKQNPSLARKQLGLAFDLKQEEFDEIMSLTNPSVKKRLLEAFADDADAAAVHLKAAALPRQSNAVILPVESLKENEVFAPGYRDGDRLVLIRHPHGGTFEIPEVVVNNKNPEAINNIGKNAQDAIGIHPNVAQRLSGADFDGDTVIAIPNASGAIKTTSALAGLKDFEPRISYKLPKDSGRVMSEETKQIKMGDVSNLITDMTIKGAHPDEIARAVRHSMVVIDAVKHELDYRQSYDDNGIADLKRKYQGSARAGASTLISKASSEKRVYERTEGQIQVDPVTGKSKRVYVDPVTGRKLYEETGRTYPGRKKVTDPETGKVSYVPTGKLERVTTKTTKLAEETDAFNLSSGTKIEGVYATHANSLKALANRARLAALKVKEPTANRSAKETYATEVESLKSKLRIAFGNKPLERRAQLLANKIVRAKRKANPDMTKEDLKKIKGQALEEMRNRTGAKRSDIKITDREWHAIQAGAISKNFLNQILLNTDLDALKERATPRSNSGLSPARLSRAKSMMNSGYTNAEIADSLGVSVSTLLNALG